MEVRDNYLLIDFQIRSEWTDCQEDKIKPLFN